MYEPRVCANDLGQAHSDYVEIYAQIKNAGENSMPLPRPRRASTIVARVIEHLSKADSMVAERAMSPPAAV